MLSSNSQKITAVVLVLVVLGALGYYFYFGGSGAVGVDILIPGESEPVGQDILVLAEKLNSISLETEIFSSPLFTRLKDLSLAITPEVQGRPNPFALIGNDSAGNLETLTRLPAGAMDLNESSGQ